MPRFRLRLAMWGGQSGPQAAFRGGQNWLTAVARQGRKCNCSLETRKPCLEYDRLPHVSDGINPPLRVFYN